VLSPAIGKCAGAPPASKSRGVGFQFWRVGSCANEIAEVSARIGAELHPEDTADSSAPPPLS
jgi:hypothetical protein